MSQNIIELNCPGCGARVSISQNTCEWCHKPITISTFNSVYSMPLQEVNKYSKEYGKLLQDNPDNAILNKSVAMCYLKLKLYDKAIVSFEKAMEENLDESETYFYSAVCLLRGKKAFLARRDDIEKAIEYIDAANMTEPRGIFYYFLAYLKYDFFERKYLNVFPDYRECLTLARSMGYSTYDVSMLFDTLGVEIPDVLK